MKKISLKAMSLFVAVVMIISLLPAVSLAADDGSITLDFTKNASGELHSTDSITVKTDLNGTNWTTDYSKSPKLVNSQTKLSGTTGISGKPRALIVGFQNRGDGTNISAWTDTEYGGENSVWTFMAKLGTDAKGYYDIKLKIPKVSNGGSFYVYAGGKYAGFVDGYENVGLGNVKSWTEYTLGPLYLEPDANGEIEIKLAYAGPGCEIGENYGRFYINSMTFTPNNTYEEPDGWHIKEDIQDISNALTMYIGDEIDLKAWAEAEDGTVLLTNNFTSEHKADSENYLKVEAAGNAVSLKNSDVYSSLRKNETLQYEKNTRFNGTFSGKLTAVNEGYATLTISAALGGEVLENKIVNVTVKRPTLESAVLTVKKNPVKAMRETTFTLDLLRDDGGAYAGEISEVIYKSSDETVATIDGDTRTIKALKAGTTLLTAKVITVDGAEKTAECELTVLENDGILTLDFTRNAKGELFSGEKGNIEITSLNGEGWRTDTDNTPKYSKAETMRREFSKIPGKPSALVVAFSNRVSSENSNNVSWTDVNGENSIWTIKAELGEGVRGYHNIKLLMPANNSGGSFYVYVDGKYAGFVDCYENIGIGDQTVMAEHNLGPVYLEADENGEVEIKFAYAGPGCDAGQYYGRVFVNGMIISPNNSYSEPDDWQLNDDIADTDGTVTIYEGGTLDFSAWAEAEDGTVFLTNGYTSAHEPDEQNNLTVACDGSAVTLQNTNYYSSVRSEKVYDKNTNFNGTYNGRLTAVSEGEATLTVNAVCDGKQLESKTVTVVVKKQKLVDARLAVAKNPLPKTRTTTFSLTPIREDGKEFMDEFNVSYTNSAPAVAELNSEAKTISALSEGTATITATLTTPDGAEVVKTVDFTVSPKPILGEITASAENSNLLPGDKTEILLSGKTNDGYDADMSAFTEITYESADEAIATVDENGKVTAHAPGWVQITAKVTNEKGTILSSKTDITVHESVPSVTIDFSQTVAKSDNTLPDVTPGYTIVKAPATKLYSQYFISAAGKNFQNVSTLSTKGGDIFWPDPNAGGNETFAIAVNIPIESDYSISLLGALLNAGGIHSFYVDDQYLGDYSFYSAGDDRILGPEMTFNTVHLNAGVHTVYMHAIAKGKPDNYYARASLGTLTFTPVGGETELSHIDMGNIPDEYGLAVGEILSGDAMAYMNDGSTYHFGMYTSEGKAETENTISAAVTDGLELLGFSSYEKGKTGKSAFRVIAKEAGTDEIFTVKATVNGKNITKNVKITVTDDPIKTAGGKPESEDIFVGDTVRLVPVTTLESGKVLPDNGSAESVFSTEDTNVIEVDENGNLTALEVGTATVKVETTFNGKSETGYFEVEVLPESMTGIEITAGGSIYIRLTDKGESDTVPLFVKILSNLGNEVDMASADITAVSTTPEIATIDGNLDIHPISEGEASFDVTVTIGKRTRTYTRTLTVVKGKNRSSYYTKEKREAVLENVGKYDWAKSAAGNTDKADFYVENLDAIYDLIHSEGIPRMRAIGPEADVDKYICKYCGVNLLAEYGSYPWLHNPLQRPWKIQCPDCKRLFPSNDFGSFYELGLNEYKEFDLQRALDAHHDMLFHKDGAECTCKLPEVERSPEWYDFYGYGVEGGYLYNEQYKDVDKSETALFREGEEVAVWGVDDGWGYVPGDSTGNTYTLYVNETTTTPERHTYIAEYLFHGLWRKSGSGDSNGGMVLTAINKLTDAYYYTGDVKYGRALAILTDRIADFYADFDMTLYDYQAWRSSDKCQGKLLNQIWENGPVQSFAEGYDITYELYDDPYVLEYIKNRGKTIKFRHAKNTASQIRTNCEDGILRGGLEALTGEASAVKGKANIAGNFGYPQKTNAVLAVVLDTQPETQKWLEYLMAPGWHESRNVIGGGVDERLVSVVDHDGHGNEASSYNNAWHTSLIDIADVLDGYDKNNVADLYTHPKFVRMFYATVPLNAGYYSPEIGDSSSTLGSSYWMSEIVAMRGWENLGDPIFAQYLYLLNGNSAEGLHYDEDVKDPERLENEVQEVIDTYGPLKLPSDMMTGFGFSILRDGDDYTNASSQTAQDTRRNMWMYFGYNGGHGHADTLNLGMTAYGLNFLPDLGYPEETGMQPNRMQWVDTTLSHNTVVVNGNEQTTTDDRGKSYHFDGNGAVQVMDVSAPDAYDKITDEYRRSVVMVKVDDEISYTVDFFRVLGGNDHLYSFHASSDEIAEMTGLDMTPQVDPVTGEYSGTYVGMNVEYTDPNTGEKKIFNDRGQDPNSPQSWDYETVFPRGYTWVDKVDRDASPEEKFEIDFKIKDFNKAIKNSSGLRLRMTMLDSGNRDGNRDVHVSTVNGYPPNKAVNKNIPSLRYVFVQHTAKDKNTDLDTTFTTVLEPYRTTRYIKVIDEIPMTLVSGKLTEKDAYKAVRVEHTSGRVDYVFYSTNTSAVYEAELEEGKTLSFSGFIGVYTVQNGENTYKYLHDGTLLGESTGAPGAIEGAVEGAVVGFTDDFVFDNEIIVRPDREITAEELEAMNLPGRIVVVNNGGTKTRNGSYKIENAYLDGKNIVLDIGSVTLVKQYQNSMDPDDGFIFNIEIGQSARIPLTYTEENNPEFTSVPGSLTVSAGSSVSAKLVAESPLPDVGVTYRADILPRGASFNAETATFTWKPDSSQVGENHAAITAIDDFGRESTAHFIVTVYGSTTSKPSSSDKASTDNSGTSNDGTSSGGGGGGGGGGAPTPDTETTPDDTEADDNQTDNVGESGEGETLTQPNVGNGGSDIPQFTDLGSHAWASDAINALADEGIIKGTTASTFSPANNITRADFALLLVRAFKLTSDNAENFADVSASDYFASELAIARNNGLVGGVGDNKYAPRNHITRQDMMVIVYRALNALSVAYGDSSPERRAKAEEYADFDTVAPYARDAVSYLIANGLVNGKSGRIAPTDYTTRAEVAVLLNRILEYIK